MFESILGRFALKRVRLPVRGVFTRRFAPAASLRKSEAAREHAAYYCVCVYFFFLGYDPTASLRFCFLDPCLAPFLTSPCTPAPLCLSVLRSFSLSSAHLATPVLLTKRNDPGHIHPTILLRANPPSARPHHRPPPPPGPPPHHPLPDNNRPLYTGRLLIPPPRLAACWVMVIPLSYTIRIPWSLVASCL